MQKLWRSPDLNPIDFVFKILEKVLYMKSNLEDFIDLTKKLVFNFSIKLW